MSDLRAVVIGGGLAGGEAAWQLARSGCRVRLYEMKPRRFSPAHHCADLAELVCSNSLRSDSLDNAAGLLKEELRLLGSLVMRCAEQHRVPAGSALAVDRLRFSAAVTAAITDHPHITVMRQELTDLPDDSAVIIATGPLTSDALAASLGKLLGKAFLYFHDAISPIVAADSIDFSKVFSASRYNKGTPDYLNCPLTKDAYHGFVSALLNAEKVPLRSFETLVPFEGCMPIEVMAERGPETLAHGPMKPVGLVDPRTGQQPYAAVQLRQETREATMYNLVGFQTRLTWPEQRRIFSMLPGLEHAEFVRYGSLHRNTYINAPRLLQTTLQLREMPRLFFAGQITGVEGYVESCATGLWAGLQAARFVKGQCPLRLSPATMVGALLAYIASSDASGFQPMNANFGILAPLGSRVPKTERKRLYAQRALDEIRQLQKGLAEQS